MASLSISDIAALLKERYPNGLTIDRLYRSSPFLAMITKDKDLAYGKNIRVPIRYAHPQGVSATFATGRTNMVGSAQKAFDVTTSNYYGFGQVDGEAIKKGSRDVGSFIKILEGEVDGAMYQVERALTKYFFGNGGGSLGTISADSTVASVTIKLTNPSDIVFFEPNMVLVAASTDGTSGAIEAGSVTVTKVNRVTGELTAGANWSAGIATLAVGMHLFRQGDFGTVWKGYRAWVPDSAPSATTFFGVDRTTDTRLGGLRGDLSALPIREAVQTALELVHREDSMCDFGVLNSLDYKNLALSLQGAGMYNLTTVENEAGVGIKAISVMGPRGECAIISDPCAPKGRLLMGERDTWKLCTMGDMVEMLQDDGNAMLRVVDADAVELRLVSRGQLVCFDPGKNGNFQIA
jgi:hypothetical protein